MPNINVQNAEYSAMVSRVRVTVSAWYSVLQLCRWKFSLKETL